jgi:2-phosphosulfolactate phosphatase
MKIEILHLLEGARKARGLTVIIDVFRAFSLACYIADKGAKEIIPIGRLEDAFMLKDKYTDVILVGERNEQVPPGFDYGNSPTHLIDVILHGKTVIHSTSAGTQGIVNAAKASEIITGSFVNAPAIVRYIQNKNPETVSLVCMGYSLKHPIEEDTFCAEYIKSSLEGTYYNYAEKIEIIRHTSGRRLFAEENQSVSPSTDFFLCTDLGRFNFVLRAEKASDGYFRLIRMAPE